MIPLRRLALAAAGLVVLGASSARACDDDRLQPPPDFQPAPSQAWPAPPPPVENGDYVPPGRFWRPEPAPWHGHDAREALLREYRRLDWARDRFYRRWGWNPGRVSRFEAWYAARRSELDHRWAELDRRWDDDD